MSEEVPGPSLEMMLQEALAIQGRSRERLVSGLPNGTVTSLFADIAGSIHLVPRAGVRRATIPAEFRMMLRAAAGRDLGDALRILHPSAR